MNKQAVVAACVSAAFTASLMSAMLYTGNKTLKAFEACTEADTAQEQAVMQAELEHTETDSVEWAVEPTTYISPKEQVASLSIAVSGGSLAHNAIIDRIAELEKIHYVGECTLTAYCCEPYAHICGTGTGITASGLVVQPGLVAVDPKVIPLGSTVIVGEDVYLAADTGGAIKGNKIDIAMETHAEALEFGKQTANVWYIEP